MALETTGLVTQTFEEVLESIITNEQTLVSSDINVDDDTALGQTNQIMAAQIALVNQGLQDIYDSRDLTKAEGKALDDVVSWLGITRQAASATYGTQYFIGDNGVVIPLGAVVRSETNSATYTVTGAVQIINTACKAATVGLIDAFSGVIDYEVIVDGASYLSGTGEANATAMFTVIADAINLAVVNYSASVVSEQLIVVSDDAADISVTHDEYLVVVKATSAGSIRNTVTGTVSQPANSVQTIISAQTGWDSTNNPAALVTGRELETDAELRIRATSFTQASGRATVDSIRNAILAISGVSSCQIFEQFVSDGPLDSVVTIDTVLDTTLYQVTVNNIDFDYTSDGSATDDEITAGLTLAINGGNCGIFATDNVDGTLNITATTAYRLDTSVNGNMTPVDGQPSGSIFIVVTGGDSDDIWQTIWDYKGAGVETWDDNDSSTNTNPAGTVKDSNGDDQFTSFARPTSIPIEVEVDYRVFDEAIYPATDEEAEEAISAAINEFGNDLASGEDVESDTFVGVVYCAVGGLKDVVVRMSKVSNPPPIIDNSIVIASSEKALFADSTNTITRLA